MGSIPRFGSSRYRSAVVAVPDHSLRRSIFGSARGVQGQMESAPDEPNAGGPWRIA